jgi:multiple sugar transport system substrate-binding protein
MGKWLKSFLFLILSLTLITSACSNNNTDGSGNDEDSSSDAVTISYFTWDAHEAKYMEAIAEDFHKENPNIKVKVEQTDWDNYWTKLKTAMAGGESWDVFLMNGPNFPDFVNNGVLENLQDDMEAVGFEYQNLPEGLRNLYTYNGSLYAAPGEVDTVGLLYNKELFDAAGIPYPDPKEPYTWEEFVNVAKQLTNAPEQWGFGTSEGNLQTGFYPWMYSNGGQLFNEDWSEALINSPENVEAVTKVTDLVLKHKVAPPPEFYGDASQIDQMFYSGKIGMIIAGTWYVANIAAENPDFEWDFAPFPTLGEPSNVVHGIGHVVYANSKHKEEAIKFAIYTSLKENQERMQTELGWMSFFEGLPEQFAAEDPNHNRSVFIDALEVGQPYPATPNMNTWETELRKQLQLVFLGEVTVEEALKKTEEKMKEAFSN